MTDMKSAAPTPAALGKVFQEAYERHSATIEATPADKLVAINIDLGAAVTTALGILSRLNELREQAGALPLFSISSFDNLGDYARALTYAHSVFQAAISPPGNLQELNAKAVQLRQVLMADATALATRKLLDGKQLTEFKGLVGYKNVAFDLVGLATALRGGWERISGKTALTLAELERAEHLANQLLVATGEKEQTPPEVIDEAKLRRQQAFTVFVSAYDQVRRAVIFLRWAEGDADEIAPSLYAKQASQGRTRREPEPVTPATPTSTSNGAPAAPVALGMPGGSLFLS